MKTRTICHTEAMDVGEQDFFFDDKLNLLHVHDRSDNSSMYDEYLRYFLKKLNIIFEEIDRDDPRVKEIIDKEVAKM